MIAYEPFFAHSRFGFSPQDPHDNISSSPPAGLLPRQGLSVKAQRLYRAAHKLVWQRLFDLDEEAQMENSLSSMQS